MLALRHLRKPGNLRTSCASHFSSSTTRTTTKAVRLAYDLHEPVGGVRDTNNNNKQHDGRKAPPIIFLHGLFGSKKNNRSISK